MGRKPDYYIHALNKTNEERGRIGSGWKQPDGSIQISFNPFVSVPVGKEFVISLFLVTDKSTVDVETPAIKPMEDEIPF